MTEPAADPGSGLVADILFDEFDLTNTPALVEE
jgi:hypothetical protein